MTLKLILILIACAIFNGCSVGGLVHISDPYIKNPGYTFSSGILKVKDIEVSVKPQTHKIGMLTAGPLIPIIPLGYGNNFDRQSHNLKIILQFKTSTTDISIIPSQTILTINGKKLSPNMHSDILFTLTHRIQDERSPPGHKWTCIGVNNIELSNEGINSPLLLKEKTCITLEYAIITPETDTEFSISIQGLQKNNIVVTVPIIYFKPGITGAYSMMM